MPKYGAKCLFLQPDVVRVASARNENSEAHAETVDATCASFPVMYCLQGSAYFLLQDDVAGKTGDHPHSLTVNIREFFEKGDTFGRALADITLSENCG